MRYVDFMPYNISEEKLKTLPIKEGQLICTTDTHVWYLDKSDTERVLISPGKFTDDEKTSEIFNDYTNNAAKGKYQHVEGTANTGGVWSQCAHLEGTRNSADNGSNSHVEGQDNISKGTNNHVEGEHNTVETNDTHSEGRWNTANGGGEHHIEGYSNTVSGDVNHMEGSDNKINGGSNNHVEGWKNTVYGNNNHAENEGNTISGDNNHASGYDNSINGDWCAVFGRGNIISNDYNAVFGKYNVDKDLAFCVGIGTAWTPPTKRKNGLELDWDGNLTISGYISAQNILSPINISNSIDQNSTNEMVAGSKAVYDFVTNSINPFNDILNNYGNRITQLEDDKLVISTIIDETSTNDTVVTNKAVYDFIKNNIPTFELVNEISENAPDDKAPSALAVYDYIEKNKLTKSDVIDETSTNDTIASSKAVYDYVQNTTPKIELVNEINENSTDKDIPSAQSVYNYGKKSTIIDKDSTNDTIPTSKAVYDFVPQVTDTIDENSSDKVVPSTQAVVEYVNTMTQGIVVEENEEIEVGAQQEQTLIQINFTNQIENVMNLNTTIPFEVITEGLVTFAIYFDTKLLTQFSQICQIGNNFKTITFPFVDVAAGSHTIEIRVITDENLNVNIDKAYFTLSGFSLVSEKSQRFELKMKNIMENIKTSTQVPNQLIIKESISKININDKIKWIGDGQ